MQLQELEKREITMDAGKANVYSLFFLIPTLLVFGIPYWLLWHHQLEQDFSIQALRSSGSTLIFKPLLIPLIILAGIILHELIHGITWSLYCKQGFKSISFGVIWKYLTPYCHCKETITIRQYLIGALMPAFILGIVPAITGIITGHLGTFLFGVFFTFAAGGDFLIALMLRKENKTNLVQDHPSQIGCFIYNQKPETK